MASNTTAKFAFTSSSQSSVNINNSTYKKGSYYTSFNIIGGTEYQFPLPSSLSDDVDVGWQAYDVNVLWKQGIDSLMGRWNNNGGLDAIMNGGDFFSNSMDALNTIGKGVFTDMSNMHGWTDIAKYTATQAGINTLGSMLGMSDGVKQYALRSMQGGRTRNNNKTMFFGGLDLRNFSLSFKLVPFSASEASVIKNALANIKSCSLPEMDNGDYFFKEPNKFSATVYIGSMPIWSRGPFVIKSMKVNLIEGETAFHSDGNPVAYSVSFDCQETELYTKNGYSDSAAKVEAMTVAHLESRRVEGDATANTFTVSDGTKYGAVSLY